MATTTAITIYYIGVYVECGLGGWAYLTEDPATGKVSCSRGRASDNLIHREPIYLELMVKILAEAGPDISYVEFRCYHQDIVDWFTKLNLGLSGKSKRKLRKLFRRVRGLFAGRDVRFVFDGRHKSDLEFQANKGRFWPETNLEIGS